MDKFQVCETCGHTQPLCDDVMMFYPDKPDKPIYYCSNCGVIIEAKREGRVHELKEVLSNMATTETE